MRFWRTTDIRSLNGGNALEVAAALNRSPCAVQDRARRAGLPVPRMPHARYWPAETRQRAVLMRSQQMSVARISEALGVPFGTVRRWVYADKASGQSIAA